MKYFECVSDDNTVTIDDTTKRYYLKKVFKLSSCTYIGSGTTYGSFVDAYSFSFYDDNDLVAIMPLDNLTETSYDIYSAGSTSETRNFYAFSPYYDYENNLYYIFINKGNSATYDADRVYIYIFSQDVTSSDKFGLEVFAADGTTQIYHSSNFPMNIDGYTVTSDVASTTGSDLTNHAAYSYNCGNKKIAVCTSSLMSTFVGQFYGMFNLALIVFHCGVWWKTDNTLGFYRDAIVDSYITDTPTADEYYAFYKTMYSSCLLLINVTNAPTPT